MCENCRTSVYVREIKRGPSLFAHTKDSETSQRHTSIFKKAVNIRIGHLIRRGKIENEKVPFLVYFSVLGLDNGR